MDGNFGHHALNLLCHLFFRQLPLLVLLDFLTVLTLQFSIPIFLPAMSPLTSTSTPSRAEVLSISERHTHFLQPETDDFTPIAVPSRRADPSTYSLVFFRPSPLIPSNMPTLLPANDRRAPHYDVDHYRGLRVINGFLDASRVF